MTRLISSSPLSSILLPVTHKLLLLRHLVCIDIRLIRLGHIVKITLLFLNTSEDASHQFYKLMVRKMCLNIFTLKERRTLFTRSSGVSCSSLACLRDFFCP